MKLRARWGNPLPEIGDVLRSRHRPRFAYVIAGITAQSIMSDPDHPGCSLAFLTFDVERIPAADVPPGAVVHDWRWDPRGRARRTS